MLRNQLENSSLSDPHGSFLLSANNGGLTKHVRNTPGWKQDRLAESAPTSFGETKKSAVRAYQFSSVKPSFDFTEFAHSRLSLYSSCWRVVFFFSLLFFSPSLKKLPHRLWVFDSSPPPVAVNNSKISRRSLGTKDECLILGLVEICSLNKLATCAVFFLPVTWKLYFVAVVLRP